MIIYGGLIEFHFFYLNKFTYVDNVFYVIFNYFDF